MARSIVIIVLLAATALAEEPDAKTVAPDDAAQKAALALIADVYRLDYEKAKTAAQKIELAKKLLQEGEATKDDLVGRFVLFRVARDIAAQQGNLETAFQAVGRMAIEYDVDALAMKVEATGQAVKALKTNKDYQACAALLSPLVEEAISVDEYGHAKSLADLTLRCARESRDGEQIKKMVAKLKEIDEIASEFEKVKEAKAVLKTKPSDPSANLAVGRFRCFAKGDWRHGVTMLALGDDEALKSAALLELAETPDVLKIGDAWWKIAETLDERGKARVQAHAAQWYRRAVPNLSGLTKARVERLLAQVPHAASNESASDAAPSAINLLVGLDVKQGAQLGTWALERKSLAGGGPAKSTFNFPQTIEGDYDLKVVFRTLQRDENGFSDVIFALPVAKSYLYFRSTGDGKTTVAFFGIDAKPHGFALKPGTDYQAQIAVRDGGNSVKVAIDDTVLLNVNDLSKATRHGGDKLSITLSPKAVVAFSSIELLPTEPAQGSSSTNSGSLKILERKQYVWADSKDNYAVSSGAKLHVGMGNRADGYGIGSAGILIEDVDVLKLQVAADGSLKNLDDNSFAGFFVDYSTPKGFSKRVAFSFSFHSDKRWDTRPDWGSKRTPDAFVNLGRANKYQIDLKKHAPSDWDGKVWLTAHCQNAGRGVGFVAELSDD
jgi:hypothetical protein